MMMIPLNTNTGWSPRLHVTYRILSTPLPGKERRGKREEWGVGNEDWMGSSPGMSMEVSQIERVDKKIRKGCKIDLMAWQGFYDDHEIIHTLCVT